MTSYLRSWLYGSGSTQVEPTPTIETTSPPPSDDGEDTETEVNLKVDGADDDDDAPPAFPSLNSAQRVQTNRPSSATTPSSTQSPNSLRVLSDSDRMPPPPLPSLASRKPGVPLRAPAIPQLELPLDGLKPSSSLALPPSTTKPPVKPNSKKRGEKVALAPGHSALDWAALKASGADLRGVDTLMRIPPSVLKQHNKRDDAWSAFYGKVYNITPYLPYHPGGEKELLRVAGRDGTKLFATTHGWVNIDFMLDACLVGFLVAEPTS